MQVTAGGGILGTFGCRDEARPPGTAAATIRHRDAGHLY
jgi:hypothetical protein